MTQTAEIEEWTRAANAGRRLSARLALEGSRGTVHAVLHFVKRPSGFLLVDEAADLEVGRNMVTCRLTTGLGTIYRGRMKAVLMIIAHYLSRGGEPGQVSVSLGDEGLPSRVLAFCSNIQDHLIPDPSFIRSAGYLRERVAYQQSAPWADRRDMLYWRGTDTGIGRYRSIERAPRVRACLIARQNPEVFSALITKLENAERRDLRDYYAHHGLLGQRDSQDTILDYRYQLDIDGNTSAWSGLFLKLLTGSPVLKVESEWGWRQWYYPGLIANTHYVPVKPDLSDLMQKLSWLRENPGAAMRIGAAGRNFALSLTHATELDRAAGTVDRLIRLNRVAAPHVLGRHAQAAGDGRSETRHGLDRPEGGPERS